MLNGGKALTRKKDKNKKKTDNNFIVNKFFKSDIADRDLQLFYSDEQIETGKKKFKLKKKQGIKKLNADNQLDSPMTSNMKKRFKKSINFKNSIIQISPRVTQTCKSFGNKKTIFEKNELISITSMSE